MSPEEVAEIRRKCSRKMRYMNHLFCEGKIRTRFHFGRNSSMSYFGMWRFHHRNGFIRELYRLAQAGEVPSLIVFGVGNHELTAARSSGTDEACPEECLCAAGFLEYFDTLKTILQGDHHFRHVPTVVLLPSAQNEDLKPPDYAWQNNDLVQVFNSKATQILDGGRGSVRFLDPLFVTKARKSDSVDSVHYGPTTNRLLVQAVLNHICRETPQGVRRVKL
ncbi:hypothetical protein T484DRAFT_2227002 [Baffinella frigidus]|nr:hypothetical protein T484DRAFT_2227002 [Cryptophyta sp. CCMP2293]